MTPEVNPEIWDKLSHSVKQQDLRSSSTQKKVGTAGAVLCKSIEMLLEMKNSKQRKSDSDIQQLLKLNTNAVALLGHAHVDLSHRRKESIKPHLNKDYAGLCASHVPVTALLFGNDLQTQLNNIRASNRVSTTAVGSRPKNVKGHPLRSYQKFELEATPKTVLLIAGPQEEAAMISADTLDNLEVNNLLLFETHMKHYFANKVQSFKGGQLAHFFDKWKDKTSDSEVLNCVKRQFIDFSTKPTRNLGPKRKTFNISDSLVIEAEIDCLKLIA